MHPFAAIDENTPVVSDIPIISLLTLEKYNEIKNIDNQVEFVDEQGKYYKFYMVINLIRFHCNFLRSIENRYVTIQCL